MKKQIIMIWLMLGILILISSMSLVLAMPPPKFVSYDIDLSNFETFEGDWRIYIVYPQSYQLDDVQFQALFNGFKEKYIEGKKICGLSLNYEVYPKDGGMDIRATNPDCENYKYNVDYDYSKTDFNFKRAFRRYLYERSQENQDIKKIYPTEYIIENNKFNILAGEYSVGDYIFVLEKINNTDEVYFSDIKYLDFNPEKTIDWQKDDGKTFQLNLEDFERLKNNKLKINFDEKFEKKNPITNIENEPNNTNKYIFILIGIITIILIFLFLIFKKKK